MDIWSFVRLSAKLAAWHRNYLVLVYIRFWSLIWLNIGPTQSVLRIFARNFVQTCLGAPASGLSKKKNGSFFFLPTVNAWRLLTSLKACGWSGHIFAPSASPKPFNKFLAHVTLFGCSWGSVWHHLCDTRVDIAIGIRVWLFFSERAASRCSKACLYKVSRKYSKNWLRRTNIKSN